MSSYWIECSRREKRHIMGLIRRIRSHRTYAIWVVADGRHPLEVPRR